MRVTLARAATFVAVLSAFALPAAPAAAGGPTSALLSIPGAGSTASLYYTDPEYDELAGLVGMSEPSGTFAGQESGSGHESGPGITVTWLVHDVEPWRVDRIYLGGKDGPWISTQVSDFSGPLWDSPVLWHRPADGAHLADLLDGLGLGTKASKDTSFDGVAGAPVPPSNDTQSDETNAALPAEADTPPAAADDSTWLASAGWAAGGLVGGLVGGVLLAFAWTRRRPDAADEAPSSLGGTDGYAEVLVR